MIGAARSSWPWALALALLVAQMTAVLPGATCAPRDVSRTLRRDGSVPDYVMRYAPLVWLHSEDPFRPSDILAHIHHTTPKVNHQPIPDVPPLDLDNLAVLNDRADGANNVALTSNDNITQPAGWMMGEVPGAEGRMANATPCVVFLIDKSERETDVFFFYFYSYDRGPNISQVLEPLNGLVDGSSGMHFGDHVGDWEHNMIRFRDGEPTGIYYSQHVDGSAYAWDDEVLSMTDGRPHVYSAYGSHANYESTGDHVHDHVLLDYCDAGPLWDPVSSALFYHFDAASYTLTRLTSPASHAPAGANYTSFLYYTGLWGDAKYPDDAPVQEKVPYFGLTRYNAGPQGPIVKSLLRKGLLPDHPSQKKFIQKLVGVFMAVYPCCLRGWRVWVSLAVVVAVGAGLVVGAKRGIRKMVASRRTRGYDKVNVDVPLDDLETSERIPLYEDGDQGDRTGLPA